VNNIIYIIGDNDIVYISLMILLYLVTTKDF